MSRKGLALITALILFGSILMVNGMGLGAPQPFGPAASYLWPAATFPAATKIPSYTYAPTDAAVNITDAKLKAALYAATGKASTSTLYRSDLAALTGGLDLSGKEIAKADGLQYCINITGLNLGKNKLSTLPAAMSALVNLEHLILDDNKFTKYSDVLYTIPKLATLSLKGNDIETVPDKINTMPALTSLDLSGNKLKALPTKISQLVKLRFLNLSDNDFRTVPKELFLLPALENLNLSDNLLEELPKEAATMPKLIALNVESNILKALPAGLGNAPSLQQVYAAKNRLIIIEPTLLNGKITSLDLSVNRLTDLPEGLSGKTFDTFSVEWNFMDMTEGAAARTIAESVIAPSGKTFLRQLLTVKNVQARGTTSTVLLSWDILQDGSDGDGSWKVAKYQIYLVKGESWDFLAELDKLAGQFVATGLDAEKSYQFMVGVEYALTLSAGKANTRYFTAVDATTLNASATAEITAAPTETPALEASPTLEPSAGTPEPTAPAVETSGGNTALVVVLIIIGAIAAIALVGVLVMKFSKNNQRPY